METVLLASAPVIATVVVYFAVNAYYKASARRRRRACIDNWRTYVMRHIAAHQVFWSPPWSLTDPLTDLDHAVLELLEDGLIETGKENHSMGAVPLVAK